MFFVSQGEIDYLANVSGSELRNKIQELFQLDQFDHIKEQLKDMQLVEGLEHFAAINSSHVKGLCSKGFGHYVIFSVKKTISVVPEYLKEEDKIIFP